VLPVEVPEETPIKNGVVNGIARRLLATGFWGLWDPLASTALIMAAMYSQGYNRTGLDEEVDAVWKPLEDHPSD